MPGQRRQQQPLNGALADAFALQESHRLQVLILLPGQLDG